ncbi:Hypothetical protein R9X50_00334000 [Acrodontium crateriforme]|uniref:Uncharacterized protein n=1 Tax=Acrodontium crateriforme TaxID=150365 RepID=A0AAQ3R9C7_9PEZI|nr:Hypothetical protein R9X50_00334000 [Acrodontium crateriforme]
MGPTRFGLILMLYATRAIAGPLPRYANSTGLAVAPSLAALSSWLPSIGLESSNVDSCTSMTPSSVSISTLPQNVEVSTVTSFSFSYQPVTSSASVSSNVQQSVDSTTGQRGTTTLTLYTTIFPTESSSTEDTLISSTSPETVPAVTTSSQYSIGGLTVYSSSVAGPYYNSSTQLPSNSSSILIIPTLSESISSIVSETLTSSILSTDNAVPTISTISAQPVYTYGSLVLSYPAPSSTEFTEMVSTATLSSSPGSLVGQTSSTASYATDTTSFAYPVPESSSSTPQSTVSTETVDQQSSEAVSSSLSSPETSAETSSSTLNSFDSTTTSSIVTSQATHHHHGRPTGLPSIVTESSPAATAGSSASSEIPGITIVPVNPSAVYVTVTVTTTDAGATTTIQ